MQDQHEANGSVLPAGGDQSGDGPHGSQDGGMAQTPARTGPTDPGSLADPRALVGTWRMARVIDDRLTGTQSHVDGRLVLAAVSPGRLSWSETGWWHQSTGDVEVHRALWIERTEGGGWWVRFQDGRDFHPWTPDEPVAHDCAPDTYRGEVSGSVRRWMVQWDVIGPHKDYSMRTVLSRGAAGPSGATRRGGSPRPAGS